MTIHWVIAGLGNPGKKYAMTRHNIGFMVIEEVAYRYEIDFVDKKECRIGRGSIEDQKILLLEPLLYMNNSGIVIKSIMNKFNTSPENFIVIHDDIDIELGKLRIKEKGSSGGHKGVESIMQNINSQNFIRIKVGIGRDDKIPVEDYVLSKFRKQEIPLVKDMIHKSADAIYSIVFEGVKNAMNRFN
ncbi:MAG: aminoacyl-tRNA hydrolase [Nitrospirota bacterium]